MDTDRKPAAVPQSKPEVISPVHAVDEDTSESVHLDPSNRNLPPQTTLRNDDNLAPSAAAASSENFHDTSSMQHLTQPLPEEPPELNPERRPTGDESEIDWIVPKEEKVSLHFLFSNLNRVF